VIVIVALLGLFHALAHASLLVPRRSDAMSRGTAQTQIAASRRRWRSSYGRAEWDRKKKQSRPTACTIGAIPSAGGKITVRAIHDRGGWPSAGAIDRSEHALADWELLTDALMQVLSSSAKGLIRVDELRRAIESMDPGRYERAAYYERWIAAIEQLMIEKKVLTRDEIDRKEAELRP